MSKKRAFLLSLALLLLCVCASGENLWDGGSVVASYASKTLRYEIRSFKLNESSCYGVEIQLTDPGRQIVKATAKWKEGLDNTVDMAVTIPGCMLAVNASGYVSPVYSWIPENYPGTNADFFYTPLGSITVTHGRLYRFFRDVPYSGLTLEADGLHVYNGEEPLKVMRRGVKETWSFYEQCPLILNGESVLSEDWAFARAKASRNIICKTGDRRYFILIVTSARGMTLFDCVKYLLREVEPIWAYNLDGGPSAALYCRTDKTRAMQEIYPNRQMNVDILGFTD